jgi:hypothetical protein
MTLILRELLNDNELNVILGIIVINPNCLTLKEQ